MSTIFYNANIYTFNDTKATAQAMLVEDFLIKVIGSNEEILALQTQQTQIINLHNQCVLPGFNDAHIHIWKVGELKTFIADLRETKSIADLMQQLKQFAQQNQNLTWIIARGFNEEKMKEQRMPTKKDLDEAFPDKPVYILRTCAHIAVVNSKALAIANINENTPAPFGGEILLDENKKLNGILTETAKGLLTKHLPQYNTTAYEKMILTACEELLSLGISSATDPAVMPDLLAVYKKLDSENKLPIRINAIPICLPDGEQNPLPLPQLHNSKFLTIDTIKFFADGGLSGQTAATNRPYKTDIKNFGVLRLSYEILFPLALKARQAGFKIATHAIGDKAIDEVIKVYEAIQNAAPNNNANRIEHLGLPTNDQLCRIKNLNINIVTQPIFIKELGDNFIKNLDETYLENCYPFKAIFDHNITTAFSTDAPVVKEINPFKGIQTAIDRKTATNKTINISQTIDLKTSIQAYTTTPAKVHQQHNIKGSLSPNMLADFIVVNQDIFKTMQVENTQIIQTYVGGICKYNAIN